MRKACFALAGIFALCVFTLCAWAGDVAGTWKGSLETPNGTVDNTFVFKVDGSKLTGTMDNTHVGHSDISEGKVDGENLSFVVVASINGNEMRINFKGKMSGEEIKLTIELPAMDQTFDLTLKKATS